jgi:hypothetical protein
VAEPRREHARDRVIAGLALRVVGQADARPEGLLQRHDHRRELGDTLEAAGGEEQRVLLVREHGRLLGRELEPSVAAVLDDARRSLVAQPFEQPPRVQPGLRGKLVGGERTGVLHRLVQSEPIAERDQRGHDRSLQMSEDVFDELHRLVHVERLLCHTTSLIVFFGGIGTNALVRAM